MKILLSARRLILLTLCITTVFGAPRPDSNAQIIKYEFVPNSGDGSYSFKFLQTDGTKREESGRIKLGQDGEEILEIKGIYKYYNDDGEVVVNYIADDNGYREFSGPKSEIPSDVQHFPAAALGSLVGGGLG